MSDDRELLLLAAKAAGYEVKADRLDYPMCLDLLILGEGGRETDWNPLTDDGDALRLAVKCRLKIDCNLLDVTGQWDGIGIWLPGDESPFPKIWSAEKFDIHRGLRGAIVRAAAAIGESTP